MTAVPTPAQTDAPATHRGVPAPEAIDDFRLACTSRAIDDRQIVVGELAPLLTSLSLKLFPVPFNLLPVHTCDLH